MSAGNANLLRAQGTRVGLLTIALASLLLLSPSGDLSVRGIKAAAVTATQSGDIHLAEIAGDVAAETTAGNIAMEGVLGSASARTTSGDIQAIRLDGASFKGESQSGDIVLSEAIVPTITLSAVSGDSTLRAVSCTRS